MKPLHLLLGLGVLASPGCILVADDGPNVGTLSVEWSIAGYADPADCDVNRIDYLELQIYDARSDFVTEVEAPCASFGVSVDLVDGLYDVDATLIDAQDRAVTTTVTVTTDIRGGTDLILPIDFPPSSFL